MIRLRRYREFLALTLFVSFILFYNFYDGTVTGSTAPKVPAFDFKHEAKENPPQIGLVNSRPRPPRPHVVKPSRANGRPDAANDRAPAKPLVESELEALGPVIHDAPPTPDKPLDHSPPALTKSLDHQSPESDNDDNKLVLQPGKLPGSASDSEKEENEAAVSIQTSDPLPNTNRLRPTKPEKYPVSSTIPLPLGTPSKLPKVQYDFSDKSTSADVETDRLAKLKAIKDATILTWKHYRKQAWTHDEIKPVAGGYRDPFGGMAATLVDSLDTLYIMGLEQEFKEAVDTVARLNFAVYKKDKMPVFEVVIRYLGGLLGAYDISGGTHTVLLDKAVELADYLLAAFDTPNRMPHLRWDHRLRKEVHGQPNANLAETGSLLLEFTRLAQLTKEFKYYDVVARIEQALQDTQEETHLPGLWSLDLNLSGCNASAEASSKQTQTKGHDRARKDRVALIEDDDTEIKPAKKAGTASTLDIETDKLAVTTKDDTTSKDTGEFDDLMSSIDRKAKEAVLESDKSEAKASVGKALADKHESLKKRQLDLPSDSDEELIPTSTVHVDKGCVKQPPVVEIANRQGVYVYALGSRADSTYEYLPKEYVLLGGLEKSYENMFTRAMDVASTHLLYRPMTPDNSNILFIGKLGIEADTGKQHFLAESTHLGCYAGGMYAYGSKLFDRPDGLAIAKKLTEGCVWAYNITATGIMPEDMTLSKCKDASACTWDEEQIVADKKYDNEREVFGRRGETDYPNKMDKLKPLIAGKAPPDMAKAKDDAARAFKTLSSLPESGSSRSATDNDDDDIVAPVADSKLLTEDDTAVESVKSDKARSEKPKKDTEPLPHDPETKKLKKRQLNDDDEVEDIDESISISPVEKRKESYEEAEFSSARSDRSEKSGADDTAVPPEVAKPAVSTDDDDDEESVRLKKKKKLSASNGSLDESTGESQIKSGKTVKASGHSASDASEDSDDVLSSSGSSGGAGDTDPDKENSGTKTGTQNRLPGLDEVGKVSATSEKESRAKLPEGVVSVRSADYKLRPEAIESVWYMYRITGDEHWRTVGWQMWQAIEQATKTNFGYSALVSVLESPPRLEDKTESFWVAETLKYFYLLFADESVVSLDEWVLNTEAHPFRRPNASHQ